MSATIKWILALVSVLTLAGIFGSGVWVGHRIAKGECASDKLTSVSRAIKQADEQAAINAQFFEPRAEKRAVARRQNTKKSVEAARHVATHPDLYSQRLDPVGLCLARSAAAGDNRSCAPGSNGLLRGDPATGTNSGRSAR